ncbi:MAG: tetratricopeptide repeat protein [Gammaproteobacteria bacterium]|jgi:TonB family protein|nr:tetratricopeptide repeat protein [Gammaproteobacteria bacterium]|tara:strand:- start:276 stop:1598 length:1323 start_codon:yes stop_codon:yes gene_type:complete
MMLLSLSLGNSQINSQETNEESNLLKRNELQEQFLNLFDQERYEESIAIATSIVDLTEKTYGSENYKLITPLNNLASAFYMIDDFDQSKLIFQRCIKLIEANQNIISPELISPLYGFGLTLNRFEEYDEAVNIFERALRINHVNAGFYNLEQLKIHDSLTESFIGLRDFEKANHHQSFQVYVNKNHFGIENPMVDESLVKLAKWYKRSGQVYFEREIHEEVLERQIKRNDQNLGELVETFKNISYSHRREGMDIYQSLSPLKKALKAIDESEEKNLFLKLEVLLDLGDTYNSFGRSESAKKAYQDCWGLIDEDESMGPIIKERFSKPIRVRNVLIPPKYPIKQKDNDTQTVASGFIAIQYTINLNGNTDNIEIIESEPQKLIDKVAISAIRNTVYRPVYIDGVPKESIDMVIRHTYSYPLEDIEKTKPKIEDKPLDNPIA